MKGGVYVYRCNKPGAIIGLPFFGRHFAYVGETKSFYHRDIQHLRGGGTYDSVWKDWADLRPKCYRIPLPPWKWLMRSVETVVIALAWPVYNQQKNMWNPRRISPRKAAAQRRDRDSRSVVRQMIGAIRYPQLALLACVSLAVYAYVVH